MTMDRHVQIDSEIISPVTVVRDLGVYLVNLIRRFDLTLV